MFKNMMTLKIVLLQLLMMVFSELTTIFYNVKILGELLYNMLENVAG